MSDANDILSHGGKGRIPEDRLMAYLEGKLSPDEQHDVELWLADEGMESDALEGLRQLQPQETAHSINKLNHDLRKTLHKKRERRKPKADQFTWIAIVIILLLAVVAYIVIRKSM